MTPPPRPARDLSLYANCSRCGHGKLLASGYNALGLGTARKIEILLAIGWSVIPKILCRACACPMDVNEWMEYKKLKYGKDDASVGMLCAFKAEMKVKYGDEVMEKFFTTPEV